MITLDYRDRRPLYEQVLEGLKDLMIRGILEQGEKLPSVRSLATDLAINPNTIQRAYAELERSGFIYSVQGRGSFVADLGAVHQERVQEWEREFDELMEYLILFIDLIKFTCARTFFWLWFPFL